jgi:hypothetical protein
VIPFLLACASPPAPPDIAHYAAALRTGDCATVRDAPSRDDCWLALADEGRRLSIDPHRAGATFVPQGGANVAPPPDVCSRVEDRFLREECWFLRAEATDAPALCADTGDFRDSCRLHLLTQRFAREQPAGLVLGQGEETAAASIAAAGFALDDLRPWSTWYRWILARQVPLDRPACQTLSTSARIEACAQMALIVYRERLQVARAEQHLACGAPLPPDAAYVPDPEIERIARQPAPGCR